MLTELEKQVIAALQGDIPVVSRPYLEIAETLGITETQLLEVIQDLVNRGIIRRFGATLRHQKSGYAANAMVAWAVDEAEMETVGHRMAASRHISHCYRRDPGPDWPYNLYTMVHARNEDACHRIARKLSERTGVRRYTLLFSRRELKKTSMTYFPPVPEN